ncbi:SRPBCC family protein [Aquipseudomonas campi]
MYSKFGSLLGAVWLSLVFCGNANAERNVNEQFFAADIADVYDYVTQPDRWHEWHPVSLGAETGTVGTLPNGHKFKERIKLFGQEVEMNYEVVIASPPNEFKTVFTSPMIDGSIHYQLVKQGNGTVFKRTLDYSLDKYIQQLKSGMVKMSDIALNNLKNKVESHP